MKTITGARDIWNSLDKNLSTFGESRLTIGSVPFGSRRRGREDPLNYFIDSWWMFWVCRRWPRRQASALQGVPSTPHPAFAEETVLRWLRLSGELLRLAFKRRLWAHLGRWLRAIKNGVRLQTEINDWWTAL